MTRDVDSREAGRRARGTPRDLRVAGMGLLVCLCGVTRASMAQAAPGSAQQPPTVGPPVRRIETASAISREPLGAITSVRQLRDGRVLLNDGTRRRLLLLDSTLTQVRVVLDSLTEVENAYGTRAGAMFAYRGDSTVFIDPATLAMLIFDPSGRVARVRSIPRAEHVTYLGSPTYSYGVPGIDAHGRLVYRIPARSGPPAVAPPPGVPYFPSPPDSAFVVAMHVESRRLDTLGSVRIPRQFMTVRMNPGGGYNVNGISNPLPLVDDWAVLADGTVAFVRGRDYRVEFVDGDSVVSADKMPFPWVRITPEDKERMADSMATTAKRNAMNSFTSQMITWANLLKKPYPSTFEVPDGYRVPPGLPKEWVLPKGLAFPSGYVYACAPGAEPPATGPATALTADMLRTMEAMKAGETKAGDPKTADANLVGKSIEKPADKPSTAPSSADRSAEGTRDSTERCEPNRFADEISSGYTPPPPTYRPPATLPARELPDYRPPFGSNAVRADADGNLWIRTIPMARTTGGVVYDIVDRRGTLVDRVQLPPGYTLVGFGAGKVVYLSMRDKDGLHLARVQLR